MDPGRSVAGSTTVFVTDALGNVSHSEGQCVAVVLGPAGGSRSADQQAALSALRARGVAVVEVPARADLDAAVVATDLIGALELLDGRRG